MWDFAWTDSATLIAERINEELMKRGQGDLKVEFSLPINWIDVFDIMTNFRLQEPFGLDGRNIPPVERGEKGRYYYIESLTYDWMNQKINVVAVDLQFILRQIMIVADCAEVVAGTMSETWAGASESDRMFAYVGDCTTETFESDGSPLKRVSPCLAC